MNKFVRKNKKGFTLTEMIVVIAIIGILAAVMIPSVVIYVNKARQNAAYQQAVAVLDFYDAYNTEKESGLLKEVSESECQYASDHAYGQDGKCTNVLVCGATGDAANVDDCKYAADKKHELENGKCTNHSDACGYLNPAHPGDSIYTDFFDYYEEMTGKAVPTGTEFNDAKTQFTYVAENGVKVIITLSDMSVTYSK